MVPELKKKTVKDLIEELSKFDGDLVVCLQDSIYGYDYVFDIVEVTQDPDTTWNLAKDPKLVVIR